MSIKIEKVTKEEAELWGGKYADTITLDELRQEIIEEKKFRAEEKAEEKTRNK